MDGSGVVMRILNKDEITADEKMNNYYAELLYDVLTSSGKLFVDMTTTPNWDWNKKLVREGLNTTFF